MHVVSFWWRRAGAAVCVKWSIRKYLLFWTELSGEEIASLYVIASPKQIAVVGAHSSILLTRSTRELIGD